MALHHKNTVRDDLLDTVAGNNTRDNSWTFEVFYNYEVTKWAHLTPSLQYAQNDSKDDDPATIPGVRMVIDF